MAHLDGCFTKWLNCFANDLQFIKGISEGHPKRIRIIGWCSRGSFIFYYVLQFNASASLFTPLVNLFLKNQIICVPVVENVFALHFVHLFFKFVQVHIIGKTNIKGGTQTWRNYIGCNKYQQFSNWFNGFISAKGFKPCDPPLSIVKFIVVTSPVVKSGLFSNFFDSIFRKPMSLSIM